MPTSRRKESAASSSSSTLTRRWSKGRNDCGQVDAGALGLAGAPGLPLPPPGLERPWDFEGYFGPPPGLSLGFVPELSDFEERPQGDFDDQRGSQPGLPDLWTVLRREGFLEAQSLLRLRRSIDEIYLLCEFESDETLSEGVQKILLSAAEDFGSLRKQLQSQQAYTSQGEFPSKAGVAWTTRNCRGGESMAEHFEKVKLHFALPEPGRPLQPTFFARSLSRSASILNLSREKTQTQAMKYLLAVVVALISQAHGTFLKAAGKAANCGLCANKDLNDVGEFKRCNYWGDPHYTATWGPRNRFDYQGPGLHSVVDNTDCGGFKAQAFHCQYKSSRNTVTIGLAFSWTEEASGTTVRVFMDSTGIYVQQNGIDVAPGTAVSYVSVPPGPVTSAQWKTGVSVQTGNECNYALVTLKTISGKPGYIMSVNLRAHDEVDAAQGICGTDDLGSTYIGESGPSLALQVFKTIRGIFGVWFCQREQGGNPESRSPRTPCHEHTVNVQVRFCCS
ncbi:SLC38A6 [Symbiodinium sp. CCMP2456]|nr:SLC38A6 [Symbiodinium sp. CCMP2456]